MKRLLPLLLLVLGVGCTSTSLPTHPAAGPAPSRPPASVDLPVAAYAERRTFKAHGEYIQDRFRGYHAGDDIEYADVPGDVPVRAIADGVVRHVGRVSGYGGLVIIEHTVGNSHVLATYGHLDLTSTTLKAQDPVVRGQPLAVLGDGGTGETDGERKHLHFALRPAGPVIVAGYSATPTAHAEWINPTDFFTNHGAAIQPPERLFIAETEVGGNEFRISFPVPAGWEVEYVPSIKALNLFTLAGAGTARDRSQIFIRFFDSTRFETLTTVNVIQTTDTVVGPAGYTAKQYVIEKKPGVPDFSDQPAWRNTRHTVTDFRATEGRTRYYVLAANPALDKKTYADFLDRVSITE